MGLLGYDYLLQDKIFIGEGSYRIDVNRLWYLSR